MNKAAAQMKEADAAIAAQKAELDTLNQIITEADQVTLHTTCSYVVAAVSPTYVTELFYSPVFPSSSLPDYLKQAVGLLHKLEHKCFCRFSPEQCWQGIFIGRSHNCIVACRQRCDLAQAAACNTLPGRFAC